MDAAEVFAATAAERRAFADLLESLDDAQLATPSLCAGWDVRTLAAHLVSAADPSLLPLLRALLRSGGRPHRANDAVARREAQRPVPELVALLRARADHRVAPPGIGPRGPLTEVLVHTADAAGPLGLAHDPRPGGVRAALDFVTTGRPVGFVRRGTLAGLSLHAEDLGGHWGEGAQVVGRGVDLLVAACGRSAVLEHLTGPGVAVLAERIA